MSSVQFLRLASRARPARATAFCRWNQRQPATLLKEVRTGYKSFSTSGRKLSDEHGEESFEEFTARYGFSCWGKLHQIGR